MQSGFWRKCRVCIRWLRRAALVAVLAAICAFLWFNRVGLPDFLKRRLVDSLHARGVELQFDRMRLSLVNGLVAENVRIGHAAGPDSPALSAREVRLELDYAAMLHRRLQLDGLVTARCRLHPAALADERPRARPHPDRPAFPRRRHLVARQFSGRLRGRAAQALRRHRSRAGDPQLGNFPRPDDQQSGCVTGAVEDNFPICSSKSISPARRS